MKGNEGDGLSGTCCFDGVGVMGSSSDGEGYCVCMIIASIFNFNMYV